MERESRERFRSESGEMGGGDAKEWGPAKRRLDETHFSCRPALALRWSLARWAGLPPAPKILAKDRHPFLRPDWLAEDGAPRAVGWGQPARGRGRARGGEPCHWPGQRDEEGGAVCGHGWRPQSGLCSARAPLLADSHPLPPTLSAQSLSPLSLLSLLSRPLRRPSGGLYAEQDGPGVGSSALAPSAHSLVRAICLPSSWPRPLPFYLSAFARAALRL